jgi:hemoglobin
MKKDIETRKDIEELVDEFYVRVKEDEMIGFIFTSALRIDWNKHLPIMYDFWENVLFYSGSYQGNPLQTHKSLNQKIPLTPEYFERWVALFHNVVDDKYLGSNASLIKSRASSIANVMQLKITHAESFFKKSQHVKR